MNIGLCSRSRAVPLAAALSCCSRCPPGWRLSGALYRASWGNSPHAFFTVRGRRRTGQAVDTSSASAKTVTRPSCLLGRRRGAGPSAADRRRPEFAITLNDEHCVGDGGSALADAAPALLHLRPAQLHPFAPNRRASVSVRLSRRLMRARSYLRISAPSIRGSSRARRSKLRPCPARLSLFAIGEGPGSAIHWAHYHRGRCQRAWAKGRRGFRASPPRWPCSRPAPPQPRSRPPARRSSARRSSAMILHPRG